MSALAADAGLGPRSGPADLTRPSLSNWAATYTWCMLIGGQLVQSTNEATYEIVDPFTERPLASAPAADAATVDRAVAAAQEAFPAWRSTPIRARAALLRRLAEVLDENGAELAAIDSIDTGNPVAAMRVDVKLAIELIELAAESGLELKGHTVPSTPDHLHYTVREPYGVVARIIPYNHPLMFAACKVAAPLIAGNTVVVKTPDQAPLAPLRLAELAANVFPPGVLNMISGRGPEAGDALVRHPAIRRIAFIGSIATGRAIQRAAAEAGVKTVSLELGGKNPLIVLPDADLEAAATGAVCGMNFHATGGQSCGSTSRLVAHSSIADELVSRIAQQMSSLRVGDPLGELTQVGTMVSKGQFDKVLSYVRRGCDEGAELVTGGRRASGLDRGYLIEPTLFAGVRSDMTIAQDEIFGPVLSVLAWESEEEALAIANSTAFGLTASIWTSDLQAAHRFASQVEAGYVWINTTSMHYPGTPFGGVKDSGIGREEDLEEVFSFTQTKTVNVPFA